jgi:hypothetical protein
MKAVLPLRRISAVSTAALLFGAGAASAATVTYVGPNGGKWNLPANWSPAAVPVAGDDVLVVQSGTRNISVDQNVTYGAPGLNSVLVNAEGSGNLTVNSGKNFTIADSLTLGSFGKGSFNQTAGNNSYGSLVLAASDKADFGNYTLRKGTLGITSDFLLGQFGQGVFNHQNGTISVGGNFSLADQANSQAVYTQSRGALTVAGSTFVGNNGEAQMNVNRGTSTHASLQVGVGAAGEGTVNLKRGTVRSAEATVGDAGVGIFNQTGGTHTVTSDLIVGLAAGGVGSYNISRGSLNVGGKLILGVAGSGDFNQTGGKVTATGGIAVNDGSYNLTDASVVTSELSVAAGASFVTSGSTSRLRTSGDVTFDPGATISTTDLDLTLARGSDVNLSVLQTDVGPEAFGLVGNYAFRSITLESNVTLTLEGNALNDALYVDRIDLGTNSLFRVSSYIVGNGINIYYNADNEENRYLGGASYGLGGGGRLLPISELEAAASGMSLSSGSSFQSVPSAPLLISAVPEPTTGGLVALGLLALACRRRTRC